jgi:hypothetical protein
LVKTTAKYLPLLPYNNRPVYFHSTTTMFKYPLVLVFFLLASFSDAFMVSVAEEQELEVISNPHSQPATGCGARVDTLLQPNQLILHPMVTQADTFQELIYAKVLTVPVPVYSMKQPARLSAAELPFHLVLVQELGSRPSHPIQTVPVPMEQARDSWFPGYFWAPLVMQCGENHWQHVGWKFTSLSEDSRYSHFYALMVQLDTKQTTQALRIGGFQAPGWMVAAVLS